MDRKKGLAVHEAVYAYIFFHFFLRLAFFSWFTLGEMVAACIFFWNTEVLYVLLE
jgi:hypothetical protein